MPDKNKMNRPSTYEDHDSTDMRDKIAMSLLSSIYTEYTTGRDERGMTWDEGWRDELAKEAFKMADAMVKISHQQRRDPNTKINNTNMNRPTTYEDPNLIYCPECEKLNADCECERETFEPDYLPDDEPDEYDVGIAESNYFNHNAKR